MPEYTLEGEAIEGKKILCYFERRPSFGIDKQSKIHNVSVTGNPAVAILKQIWVYTGKQQ